MKRIASIAICSALQITATNASAVTVEFFNHTSFALAAGTLNVITFDGHTPGTILSGTETPGLTILARRISVIDPQDFAPGLTVGGANVNSQPNGISASLPYSGTSITFDNGNDDFDFVLSTPSNAAGLWIGNVGASNNDPNTPTTVTFFDAAGSVIASEVLTQGHAGQIGSGANNRFFYGITSDQAVASFVVRNAAGDGDGIVIDDVQFSAVPVPAAVWLLGSALTGLSAFRRSRSLSAQ